MTSEEKDIQEIFELYETGDLIMVGNIVRGKVIKKTDIYMILIIDGEESILFKEKITNQN